MDREAIKLNMFLGKTNSWEYVFIDEAFKYKDWMSWLTYSIFEFLTKDEIDKRIDDYDWIELWKDAVYRWNCTDSYLDWVDEIIDSWGAEEVVRDSSYCNDSWLTSQMELASEKDLEDYEYSDCRWWWRLWKDSEYADRENYEYVNEENFEKFILLYNEYEK